jgi:cellulose synthase/poly-beta-1,6-N-acetylglucosamine synthase-like glycosyltransferase
MGEKSFVAIAQTYFDRFPSSNLKLRRLPSKELKLIVVIPSYNEPHLIEAINSLLNATVPDEIIIEVLVVVNHSKNSDNEIPDS